MSCLIQKQTSDMPKRKKKVSSKNKRGKIIETRYTT